MKESRVSPGSCLVKVHILIHREPHSDKINKMGKSKSAKPTQAAQPIATKQVKQLSAVKNGAITKPSQSDKVKSKQVAKEVAIKANGGSKKAKKVVKEPSPEDSDMSDVSSKEEDEDESSASSASSDDGSDEEPAPKSNGSKPTVAGGILEADSSGSSESSGDEDEAQAKPAAPKQNGQATAGKKVKPESEDDSEDDSEQDAKPKGAKAVNGKEEKTAAKKVSNVP